MATFLAGYAALSLASRPVRIYRDYRCPALYVLYQIPFITYFLGACSCQMAISGTRSMRVCQKQQDELLSIPTNEKDQ